jgi:2-amino-4-hydroxy-6-hydroxymethyldihydropteridine diphosphokinase
MIYYLGLGTNLGNKKENLDKALLKLQKKGKILQFSKIYLSKAMGDLKQEDFLNMALAFKADLAPLELLEFVKEIEKDMGRIKTIKWGKRIIDIDILMIKNQKEILDFGKILKIPHEYILEREFVLLPLSEIAKNLVEEYFGEKLDILLKSTIYKVDGIIN